jgi:hypothetical protein
VVGLGAASDCLASFDDVHEHSAQGHLQQAYRFQILQKPELLLKAERASAADAIKISACNNEQVHGQPSQSARSTTT